MPSMGDRKGVHTVLARRPEGKGSLVDISKEGV